MTKFKTIINNKILVLIYWRRP